MKTIKDFERFQQSPYKEMLEGKMEKCVGPVFSKTGNTRIDAVQKNGQLNATIKIRQKAEHDIFTKIFRDSIPQIMELSRTAQTLMWYIIYSLPHDKGYVVIDNMTVMDFCKFKTRKSVRDGVIELLEKNFLARTTVPKKFWVNPLVMFNGNRIVYANEYILQDATEE